jgi:hypothetical protein
MNSLIQLKTITLPLFVPLALACFALAPQARAVCQEGCLTHQNTVLGDDALVNNTGDSNTAVGGSALNQNTTGERNTAIGVGALLHNSTSHSNTAVGVGAATWHLQGDHNTAIGVLAMNNGLYGSDNTAVGYNALPQLINTANNNIALGANAGSLIYFGSFNIDIGNPGVYGESNTIRIGTAENSTATFIAGISETTVPNGVGVVVNSRGRLGTLTSSERFKDAVRPMDKESEAIRALKPVTFHYKEEFDPDGIPQFGLVAEDVEKVNPDLVARDADGKAYTVRYEAVNAMLLNEFLKEHRKVEKLEAMVAHQRKDFEAAVAELKGQIQQVSAQLELTKPAPRTVLNN